MGIGSAPGLTNVLARRASDRLDAVASIDMVDGAVDLAADGGAFGVPYSVETILDEFTEPAMVFEDGELRQVPAGSGVVDWEFPEPVGVQPAMYTLHSEPATLPVTIPGVRDVRWRLALPRAVHDGFSLLVGTGLASHEPLEVSGGRVVPREVLAAVLSRIPADAGVPRDVEYLDVRAAGTKDGRPAVARELARFDPSPEGLSAGAFGTAIPITVSVRWQAEGRVPPGVHPPETAFDPEALRPGAGDGGRDVLVRGPMSRAIVALLIGFALFGALRARAVVSDTWDLRTRRASALGMASVAIAVLVLLALSGSLLGAIVGGVVLGVALYGSWRLRRV